MGCWYGCSRCNSLSLLGFLNCAPQQALLQQFSAQQSACQMMKSTISNQKGCSAMFHLDCYVTTFCCHCLFPQVRQIGKTDAWHTTTHRVRSFCTIPIWLTSVFRLIKSHDRLPSCWRSYLSQVLMECCAGGHFGELPDQHSGITGGWKLEGQLKCQHASLCSFCGQQQPVMWPRPAADKQSITQEVHSTAQHSTGQSSTSHSTAWQGRNQHSICSAMTSTACDDTLGIGSTTTAAHDVTAQQ